MIKSRMKDYEFTTESSARCVRKKHFVAKIILGPNGKFLFWECPTRKCHIKRRKLAHQFRKNPWDWSLVLTKFPHKSNQE